MNPLFFLMAARWWRAPWFPWNAELLTTARKPEVRQ